MANPIFSQPIIIGREERNLEYKQSTLWSREFAARLTKTILSMSNIRDGGSIIIGMKRQTNDSYLPKGMEPEHLDSYIADDVARFVNEYADPYAHFTLTKEECDDNRSYVWIQVQEFEETPVICRKSYANILGVGKLYVRTRRVPESSEVPSSAEMREILDMATEKRIRAFVRQANRAGITLSTPTLNTDKQAFDDQISGVL